MKCEKCGHQPDPEQISNETIESLVDFVRALEKFCAPMGVNLEAGARMMLLMVRAHAEMEKIGDRPTAPAPERAQ